jgi:hypothetical protein
MKQVFHPLEHDVWRWCMELHGEVLGMVNWSKVPLFQNIVPAFACKDGGERHSRFHTGTSRM